MKVTEYFVDACCVSSLDWLTAVIAVKIDHNAVVAILLVLSRGFVLYLRLLFATTVVVWLGCILGLSSKIVFLRCVHPVFVLSCAFMQSETEKKKKKKKRLEALVQNQRTRELISARKTSHNHRALVDFMYLIFTHMPVRVTVDDSVLVVFV